MTEVIFFSYAIEGDMRGRGRWLKYLKEKGYEVKFLSFAKNVNEWKEELPDSMLFKRNGGISNVIQSLHVLRKLSNKDVKGRIIVSHGHLANLILIIHSVFFKNVKIVLMVAGLGRLWTLGYNNVLQKYIFYPVIRFFLKKIYHIGSRNNNCRIVFQNSDDSIDLGIEINFENVFLIHGSGIPEEEGREQQKEEEIQPDNTEDTLKCIWIGRDIPEKNLNLALNTFKYLPDSLFSLTILGVKGESDKSNIDFLGFKSNVFYYLSKGDVLLNTSLYREGVPRTTLEAISIGVPVISLNLAGAKEGVVHSLNGFILKNNISAKNLARFLETQRASLKKMRNTFHDSKELNKYKMVNVIEGYERVFLTL